MLKKDRRADLHVWTSVRRAMSVWLVQTRRCTWVSDGRSK